MKNDSKSTDRIFQLYGVPALMAPANLLYRFDCNEWHTSQPINADDFLEKINLIRFFSKFIIYHSFCINLSFDWLWTVLSVGVHMGRHISEHYCLKQAWIKHTFTPTEGETYISKLQLFLFTSSVSIALYAFVRGKGCVCVEHRPSVGVDGCRWVSMGVESIATEHSMHYVRIFQPHGVPALLAPANLLYRFDCNEWHTSQPINYEWMYYLFSMSEFHMEWMEKIKVELL